MNWASSFAVYNASVMVSATVCCTVCSVTCLSIDVNIFSGMVGHFLRV